MGTDQETREPIRLVLADWKRLDRASLRAGLHGSNDISVVGETDSGMGAVTAARELLPDVVVIRLSVPLYNGFQAAANIARELPGSGIVIMDDVADLQSLAEALKCGARGYLTEENGLGDLKTSIRLVHSGMSFLPHRLLFQMLESFSTPPSKRSISGEEEDVWTHDTYMLEVLADVGRDPWAETELILT